MEQVDEQAVGLVPVLIITTRPQPTKHDSRVTETVGLLLCISMVYQPSHHSRNRKPQGWGWSWGWGLEWGGDGHGVWTAWAGCRDGVWTGAGGGDEVWSGDGGWGWEFALEPLADSGGGGGVGGAPPLLKFQRVFKRDPPKNFVPVALAVAAAPPSTNPGSAPGSWGWGWGLEWGWGLDWSGAGVGMGFGVGLGLLEGGAFHMQGPAGLL